MFESIEQGWGKVMVLGIRKGRHGVFDVWMGEVKNFYCDFWWVPPQPPPQNGHVGFQAFQGFHPFPSWEALWTSWRQTSGQCRRCTLVVQNHKDYQEAREALWKLMPPWEPQMLRKPI